MNSVNSNESVREKFPVDRTLFPYTPQYLKLKSGARLHYVDEGKGSVLLLLHGNPTWSFLYRHLIADLKKDFRVIAPDYPGFGLSETPADYGFTAAEHADVISEFIERLDLQDMTIMVQDWAGPIGFAAAERHPQRVHGFIIGNTWAWPLERPGHKLFSTLMGGWPGRIAARWFNGVVRFFMSKGVTHRLSEAELDMYLAPFSESADRTQTHVFPAQLRAAAPFLREVRAGLPALSDLPVLILWGLNDFAFQEPERSRFESLFPNHRTILLNNAGHFIQEDAPDAVVMAVRAWHTMKL